MQEFLAIGSVLRQCAAMCKDAMRKAVDAATAKYGSRGAVAKRLGISRQAIDQWQDKVPPKHVLALESMSGVSRYELRPDIYGASPPRTKKVA